VTQIVWLACEYGLFRPHVSGLYRRVAAAGEFRLLDGVLSENPRKARNLQVLK